MVAVARLQPIRRLALAGTLALICAGFEERGFEVYIPYVPTPQYLVERMLDLAEVSEGDYLIDLGSGDGRIPITAARRHGARGLGVEIKPELVRLSQRHAEEAGVGDKVTFRQQDLFTTPIAEATVITLYLPPSVNLQLRPRLLSDLRPGTRVVSQSYGMGAWLADKQESVRGIDVYLWIVPAHVAGEWQIEDGQRSLSLVVEQRFQELHASASQDGRALPVREARLRGDRIELSIDLGEDAPAMYRGRIVRDRIEADASGRAWQAVRVARRLTAPVRN